MALRQALLLADCLAGGEVEASLVRYNREHPSIFATAADDGAGDAAYRMVRDFQESCDWDAGGGARDVCADAGSSCWF